MEHVVTGSVVVAVNDFSNLKVKGWRLMCKLVVVPVIKSTCLLASIIIIAGDSRNMAVGKGCCRELLFSLLLKELQVVPCHRVTF